MRDDAADAAPRPRPLGSLVLGLLLVGLGAPVLLLGLLTLDPDEGWSLPTFALTIGALWLLAGLVLLLASWAFRRR